MVIEEQTVHQTEDLLGIIHMIIVYSAVTEYTKYLSTLKEEMTLRDTFIYQVYLHTIQLLN